jgi:ceramide glucosyltransferase
MSRAYKEAPSDVIWIVDCNVWIGRGTAGRIVDKICGYGPNVSQVQPMQVSFPSLSRPRIMQ